MTPATAFASLVTEIVAAEAAAIKPLQMNDQTCRIALTWTQAMTIRVALTPTSGTLR